MRTLWLSIALLLPGAGLGAEAERGDTQPVEEILVYGARDAPDAHEPDESWVDAGHAYATERTQAVATWMDEFLGDPAHDLEQAESLLRLRWTNTFDQQNDYDTKLRLRGKLQLPRISRRLNLVFSGEDGEEAGATDDLDPDATQDGEDQAGLIYTLSEHARERVDLTLGLTSDGLRPGARYRLQGPFAGIFSYRYIQRLEWEWDDGFFTTTRMDLNHALAKGRLVRLANRLVYGEETDGLEWRSTLLYNRRQTAPRGPGERVNTLFASVVGSTDPGYTRNVKLGWSVRRQFFRPYLFAELEPAYNFRKASRDESREGAWSLMLRFEIALRKDLARRGGTGSARTGRQPPGGPQDDAPELD